MLRKIDNNVNFSDLNEGALAIGSLLSFMMLTQPQITQNAMESITFYVFGAPKTYFGLFSKETETPKHSDDQPDFRIIFIR